MRRYDSYRRNKTAQLSICPFKYKPRTFHTVIVLLHIFLDHQTSFPFADFVCAIVPACPLALGGFYTGRPKETFQFRHWLPCRDAFFYSCLNDIANFVNLI